MTCLPRGGWATLVRLNRKAGFQSGDIIVALEGYRVENLAQYEAVNECFRENPEMTFTLWRGGNFERKITVPGREIDLELRSHPM